MFFFVCGFKIQNLEPILIVLVGGSCNEFVLIRRTRTCLVVVGTSLVPSFLVTSRLLFSSWFQVNVTGTSKNFFSWWMLKRVSSHLTGCFDCILLLAKLLFSVYLFCYADATFPNSIIGFFCQVSFIRRTSNLDSCFLSTFSVTSCSEIKLSELFVVLILLFGTCSSVSCWFLLMAVRNFLVTRC